MAQQHVVALARSLTTHFFNAYYSYKNYLVLVYLRDIITAHGEVDLFYNHM
jgi:hypothetical protein